jgi:methyl-accepting chemotaxis protein
MQVKFQKITKETNMKSLRKQLIIIMLLLILLPFVISNAVGYLFISKGFSDELEANNETLALSISDNVSTFVESAYKITEEVSHLKAVEDFNAEDQKNILVDVIQRNTYFDLLYIQGTDGMQTARSSGENGDRSERWWFQQIMGDKQPFVSKSYYSVNGNVPVTSVILPIYNANSELTGVMGSDLKLDALQTMVEKFSENKNSYVYILDGEGVVIAHPEKQQVSELYNYLTAQKTVLVTGDDGKVKLDENGNQMTETKEIPVVSKLKEITEKALNGESGVAEYKDENGKAVISAYSTITLPGVSDNWAVITVEKKSDAMAFVSGYLQNNIFMSIIIFILVGFAAYFISKRITKPIVNLMNLMEKASKGDLTVTSSYQSKNEIGRLSSSFNHMMTNLKELAVKIHDLGMHVNTSSKTLSDTTLQTAASIEDVSKAIGEVAQGASELATDAEGGVNAVVKLSSEIETMSEQIQQSKDFSDKIYTSNEKGLEIMKLLESKTKESNQVGKDVASIVEELNRKADEINSIVDTIMGISEQTNLLALNAAIEAARAGEAGKGFTIVAGEVKKLAENTNKSSTNVKDIIKAIQDDVDKTQETIQLSLEVSTEQSKAVDATREIFMEISHGIQEIVSRIHDITEGLHHIKNSNETVVSVIENVSAVSEETAASSEEVSASIEEQNAAAEQVGYLAHELYEIAEKLEETINMFIIN